MNAGVAANASSLSALPRLRAGEHYPRTASDFNAWFADEAACYAFLERLRWPDGIVCPGCGEIGKLWHVSARRLRCHSCRREVRITAGTIDVTP